MAEITSIAGPGGVQEFQLVSRVQLFAQKDWHGPPRNPCGSGLRSSILHWNQHFDIPFSILNQDGTLAQQTTFSPGTPQKPRT